MMTTKWKNSTTSHRMPLIRQRRRTFLLCKETGIQSKDASENWQGICGPFCNDDTNERGIRLLEFAIFNDHQFLGARGLPFSCLRDLVADCYESSSYCFTICWDQFCWDVVKLQTTPVSSMIVLKSPLLSKDWVAVLCFCLGIVYYRWISIV